MGLFQKQSAVAGLSDAELIARWLARDFDEQSISFAEQELMDRGIDPAAPVARMPKKKTSDHEEVVDWSLMLGVVIGKFFAFVGLVAGLGVSKFMMEKHLGVGGAIPNMLLAVPFIYVGRIIYLSRGGKWALLTFTVALALVVFIVAFGS